MSALRYIEIIEKNLEGITNQRDAINIAASKITDVILGGNKVFVADNYGIIEAELVNRTSGPAFYRSLTTSKQKPGEGDILIISAYHPESEDDLEHLNRAHLLGAFVITISPAGELAQAADIALLNNDDGTNGVINVSGIGRPFCPMSGIMNASLAWAISAETVSLMIGKDKTPTIFWGEHLEGGAEKLSEARKRFKTMGY